jgi:hypothetical protein
LASAIFSVATGALPDSTASVLARAAAVLTGLFLPADAYAGFANGTIPSSSSHFSSQARWPCGLARAEATDGQLVRLPDAGCPS